MQKRRGRVQGGWGGALFLVAVLKSLHLERRAGARQLPSRLLKVPRGSAFPRSPPAPTLRGPAGPVPLPGRASDGGEVDLSPRGDGKLKPRRARVGGRLECLS